MYSPETGRLSISYSPPSPPSTTKLQQERNLEGNRVRQKEKIASERISPRTLSPIYPALFSRLQNDKKGILVEGREMLLSYQQGSPQLKNSVIKNGQILEKWIRDRVSEQTLSET